MGLQKCGLNINHSKKELQPHGTLEFPCAGYASTHTDTLVDIIPWHWHEELEIVYIKKGTLKLQIPSTTYLMTTGDCAVKLKCSSLCSCYPLLRTAFTGI